MPNLTFVMPHWLYWAGLALFPLLAAYLVQRTQRRPPRGTNLPTAYLLLVTGGFVGLHRFYLHSLWGLAYLPLFLVILFSNVEGRTARVGVSAAQNDKLVARYEVDEARKAGAADRLAQARAALEAADRRLAERSAVMERWELVSGGVAGLILALLLLDAGLLPRLTRRVAAREVPLPAAEPERHPVPERMGGVGEDPTLAVHGRFTDVIDRISGLSGEFVAYWSVLAVFVYYYEVLARYVFNSPTNWAHESMFLMFGMQYLLSGAFAYREDAHVRVDVVYLYLPDRLKVITDVATSFFFFVFSVALLLTGALFAWDSISVWEVSFTEWAIQYWPVKATIGLGALLLTLQGLSKLTKDVVYLTGKEA